MGWDDGAGEYELSLDHSLSYLLRSYLFSHSTAVILHVCSDPSVKILRSVGEDSDTSTPDTAVNV